LIAGIFMLAFAVVGSVLLFRSQAATPVPLKNPMHFVDSYWDWPTPSNGLTALENDITFEADGTPDGYYAANYFWFKGDYPATGGYFGLQTNGLGDPAGKIAVFSIWGATAASGPGVNKPFEEDGIGFTSRLPFPWEVKKTYHLKVALSSITADSNVWSATITDLSTGKVSPIGQLTVPKSRGVLASPTVTFHERYAGPTNSCADLQYSQVTFTNVIGNGSVKPLKHTNIQPAILGCDSNFGTIDLPNGLRSVIGGPSPVVSPAPVVHVTSPVANTTVAERVNIRAELSDDGYLTKAELYVDGILKQTKALATTSQVVNFALESRNYQNGPHSLVVKAYDNESRTTTVRLPVTVQNQPFGLTGQYHQGTDLSNLLLTRIDAKLDFNWGLLSPDSVIPTNDFSSRWTGMLYPTKTERYTFYTSTDDGVRLWVNGQKLIDQWHTGNNLYSGSINLTAYQLATVKVEYFEHTGSAHAQLLWSSPSTPKSVIPSVSLRVR
jgi:hypothetical protein